MPFKWCDKNRGCLRLNHGKKGKIVRPGEEIPEGWVNDDRLRRFGKKIIEFEREHIVKKIPVPVKKGDKK